MLHRCALLVQRAPASRNHARVGRRHSYSNLDEIRERISDVARLLVAT